MRAVIGVLLNLTHDNGETQHMTEKIYTVLTKYCIYECGMKQYKRTEIV